MRQLENIRARQEKVIVFSEFRDIQRLLQRAIASRFDLHAPIINGDTTVDPEKEASRQRIIDRYQAQPGFNVIILSTTAVGFGVNVQAANHVIHFTRPWNPAKEDQATDRAYRIGQTKPVYVYCPTVVGAGFESFDQRVDKLLAEKRALSRDMLAGVQAVTEDDFKDL
jgi:SNF2 family DNA or RNA helicase